MSIIQSILIPKKYPVKTAELMVKREGGRIGKRDETARYHRFRQISPKKVKPNSYRIHRKGYVIFIYAKLKKKD